MEKQHCLIHEQIVIFSQIFSVNLIGPVHKIGLNDLFKTQNDPILEFNSLVYRLILMSGSLSR